LLGVSWLIVRHRAHGLSVHTLSRTQAPKHPSTQAPHPSPSIIHVILTAAVPAAGQTIQVRCRSSLLRPALSLLYHPLCSAIPTHSTHTTQTTLVQPAQALAFSLDLLCSPSRFHCHSRCGRPYNPSCPLLISQHTASFSLFALDHSSKSCLQKWIGLTTSACPAISRLHRASIAPRPAALPTSRRPALQSQCLPTGTFPHRQKLHHGTSRRRAPDRLPPSSNCSRQSILPSTGQK
jgi:hypothetical protein